MRFKVGDRVVYHVVDWGYDKKENLVGEITDIAEGYYWPYTVVFDGDEQVWPCKEEELERAI